MGLKNLRELIEQKASPQSKPPELSERPDVERKEMEQALFGKKIPDTEYTTTLLSIPRCNIEADNLHLICDKSKQALNMDANLRAEGKTVGEVHLSFFRQDEETVLDIKHIELIPEFQGRGIGLDLQCQIEDFCRKSGIKTIQLTTQTGLRSGRAPLRTGAYVWAQYGFEFDEAPQFIPYLKTKLIEYVSKRKVSIPKKTIQKLEKSIDFAQLEGTDAQERKIHVGKEFLSNTKLNWRGKKDLSPDSPETQQFVAYLKKRGRDDLIERYFSGFRKS